MIDCEHFFDGYKANRAYALAVATAAHKAGARWVVLCDTNGGTLPHEISAIVSDVNKHVPGSHLGIHTHNDTENAVANTLVAVRAGARQIQGALNGLGERCGNANLASIIPTLLLKSEFADRFETQRDAGAAAQAHARQPAARRDPEPRAQPPGALRRRGGVRHQGRHSRLRHPEGAADLRARAARERRQPAPRAGVGPGRQVEPAVRAGAAGRARRQGRSARRPAARRGEGARGHGLCLRGRGCLLRAAGAAAAGRGAALSSRSTASA